MANDSIEIIEPFDFHPCNSPRGCLYYNTHILTPDQQDHLNDFKINTIRNDQKYLASHPEIRALVSLMIRHVLIHKPRQDIGSVIGKFFIRPRFEIEEEINEYIKKMNISTVSEYKFNKNLYEEEEEEERGEERVEEEGESVYEMSKKYNLLETYPGDFDESIEGEEKDVNDDQTEITNFIKELLKEKLTGFIDDSQVALLTTSNVRDKLHGSQSAYEEEEHIHDEESSTYDERQHSNSEDQHSYDKKQDIHEEDQNIYDEEKGE